jgi:pimeloyl-ACP methyl ester carboxylesterase
MEELTGDIVIMGGYRGSILRSAKPPNRQLWVPVKVGLNIRKVNLEVGLEPEDDERMEESIFASGMLQHIGPVDISKRLFKRLRECENARNGKLRIWDYGYDWRLSPHLLSKRLVKFIESLPSNQQGVASKDKGALIVAHSLGGLITRHAVNQHPELFSGVVFAGVPQACVNILGPMRNGDAVLLSSRVLTAQVNFTFRTSFVLLPLEGYCFMDKATGEEYPVDYFNVDDWIKYRWSPCTDPPLPPKSQPTGGLANILRQGSFTSLQLPGRILSNAAAKRTAPQLFNDPWDWVYSRCWRQG